MNLRPTHYLWGITTIVLALGGAIVDRSALVSLVICVPLAALSFGLCQRADRQAKVGLVDIFAFALVARWLVACGIHYAVYETRPYLFGPDEGGYNNIS